VDSYHRQGLVVVVADKNVVASVGMSVEVLVAFVAVEEPAVVVGECVLVEVVDAFEADLVIAVVEVALAALAADLVEVAFAWA